MATVEEIVRDIQASGPNDISGLSIARWIANRYREMVSRVRFDNLISEAELLLPGVVDTGTISATRGSTTVTGDSTTFVTEVGSGSQTQYWFRAQSAWYKISTIGGETSLTLATAFAEDDVSDVAYVIVKRLHSLNSGARWIGEFTHTRRHRNLGSPMSKVELELRAPGRILAGVDPMVVAQAGVDSSGYAQVEIYPPPAESEILRYDYSTLPTDLTMSSTIPQQIDAYTLKEGALIDVYSKAMAMALDKGNSDVAAVYSNSAAKQRTIWRDALKSAQYTQDSSKNKSFVLAPFFGGGRKGTDITTAHDHVLVNWSR